MIPVGQPMGGCFLGQSHDVLPMTIVTSRCRRLAVCRRRYLIRTNQQGKSRNDGIVVSKRGKNRANLKDGADGSRLGNT